MTAPKPERSTAAKRIPLADADTLEGGDVLGTCYVKGKVVEVHAIGAVVEFRNPDGGPYKMAVHAPTWTLGDLEAGDDVEVQLALLHHAAPVKADVAVVGIPGGDAFFVAVDTIVAA